MAGRKEANNRINTALPENPYARLNVVRYDPAMQGYVGDIELRMKEYENARRKAADPETPLTDAANGFRFFGLHKNADGSVTYREWAPGADRICLYGDFNGWNRESHPMKRTENGVFELTVPAENAPKTGEKYKILVTRGDETFERIPAYANYVTQDPENYVWSAEVFFEEEPFPWTDSAFKPAKVPYIYECHVGMSVESYRVGTYTEFKDYILPRIQEDGYNTIQIMAIQEHPYYASFGYQVSSFFAPSSRYGTPRDLKALINEAHRRGIAVLLDVVHSHAIRNEREGLNRLDGTDCQYFKPGPQGDHPAWGTKLFDYGKKEVLGFLLSNLRYWMEEFHFDGFRFDGVTSMLYHDHGLGTAFDRYDKYFSMNTDTEAVAYLMLANELVHAYNENAVTIAEDMSGMPGMCLPVPDGGIGFDYRLAMGTPDLWIRYLKDVRDEDWSLFEIYNVITGCRPHEKVIGYAESHDQALVGDQTIFFRMAGADIYDHMRKDDHSSGNVDRAMALSKMIKLITFSLSPSGYLNFMGNEFGHPEWIDFPREGNGWSYHYCRRQWHLADDPNLKYEYLLAFDRAMLSEGTEDQLFRADPRNLWTDDEKKTLVAGRNRVVLSFNFHPVNSYPEMFVVTGEEGAYEVVWSTDDYCFGGYGRVARDVVYHAEKQADGRIGFYTYQPARTATVFRKK